MFAIIADNMIKGVMYATTTSVMWVWYWIFPSKQERNTDEMKELLRSIKDENTELSKKVTNIKHMLNKEQNIPDVVNMTEYINVINNLENMTASKTVDND